MPDTKEKEIKKVKITEEIVLESTYHVILFNDNVTPTQLVLLVLMSVFNKDMNEALQCINEAESDNQTIAGYGYSFSGANEKINEADKVCEPFGCKLKFEIEED